MNPDKERKGPPKEREKSPDNRGKSADAGLALLQRETRARIDIAQARSSLAKSLKNNNEDNKYPPEGFSGNPVELLYSLKFENRKILHEAVLFFTILDVLSKVDNKGSQLIGKLFLRLKELMKREQRHNKKGLLTVGMWNLFLNRISGPNYSLGLRYFGDALSVIDIGLFNMYVTDTKTGRSNRKACIGSGKCEYNLTNKSLFTQEFLDYIIKRIQLKIKKLQDKFAPKEEIKKYQKLLARMNKVKLQDVRNNVEKEYVKIDSTKEKRKVLIGKIRAWFEKNASDKFTSDQEIVTLFYRLAGGTYFGKYIFRKVGNDIYAVKIQQQQKKGKREAFIVRGILDPKADPDKKFKLEPYTIPQLVENMPVSILKKEYTAFKTKEDRKHKLEIKAQRGELSEADYLKLTEGIHTDENLKNVLEVKATYSDIVNQGSAYWAPVLLIINAFIARKVASKDIPPALAGKTYEIQKARFNQLFATVQLLLENKGITAWISKDKSRESTEIQVTVKDGKLDLTCSSQSQVDQWRQKHEETAKTKEEKNKLKTALKNIKAHLRKKGLIGMFLAMMLSTKSLDAIFNDKEGYTMTKFLLGYAGVNLDKRIWMFKGPTITSKNMEDVFAKNQTAKDAVQWRVYGKRLKMNQRITVPADKSKDLVLAGAIGRVKLIDPDGTVHEHQTIGKDQAKGFSNPLEAFMGKFKGSISKMAGRDKEDEDSDKKEDKNKDETKKVPKYYGRTVVIDWISSYIPDRTIFPPGTKFETVSS